jgi:hypothetical protein
MQLKTFRCLIVVALITLMSSSVGRADLLSGCGTCQGSTYLLTYDPTPIGTITKGNIYDVFLTIDAANYKSDQQNNLPNQIDIQTVAIKISNSVDFTNSSLVAAPGGANLWTPKNGGLSNSGGTADCDGSGAGFICAQDGLTAPVPHDGTYLWELHYATTGSLQLGKLESEIKVAYTDGSFHKVGSIVSEGITLQETVPDGGVSLVLLGGTLFGLEGLRRKLRCDSARRLWSRRSIRW